ncbi:hypothetical protein chiPu_0024975, partial [Chiloscyllium punctatum]|nr:hypothetical protein [Chiloscyllium punctatum]
MWNSRPDLGPADRLPPSRPRDPQISPGNGEQAPHRSIRGGRNPDPRYSRKGGWRRLLGLFCLRVDACGVEIFK